VADPGPLSVTLRRSGGLLPGHVFEASLDAGALDADEAVELQRLVAAANVPALAARSPIRGLGADMYQYELRVDDGGRCERVVVSGAAVPEELKPLIERLERETRRQAHG